MPIFSPDWGADEEMLLISGLVTYGLGNWLEVAGHVGTRTKEECERHYLEVYLGVGANGGDLHVEEDVQVDGVEQATRKRKREFMPVSI
jgi:transcriptional adapter 2-alpha